MAKRFMVGSFFLCVLFSCALAMTSHETNGDDWNSLEIKRLQQTCDVEEIVASVERDIGAMWTLEHLKSKFLHWGLCSLGVATLCCLWLYVRSRGGPPNSSGNLSSYDHKKDSGDKKNQRDEPLPPNNGGGAHKGDGKPPRDKGGDLCADYQGDLAVGMCCEKIPKSSRCIARATELQKKQQLSDGKPGEGTPGSPSSTANKGGAAQTEHDYCAGHTWPYAINKCCEQFPERSSCKLGKA